MFLVLVGFDSFVFFWVAFLAGGLVWGCFGSLNLLFKLLTL